MEAAFSRGRCNSGLSCSLVLRCLALLPLSLLVLGIGKAHSEGHEGNGPAALSESPLADRLAGIWVPDEGLSARLGAQSRSPTVLILTRDDALLSVPLVRYYVKPCTFFVGHMTTLRPRGVGRGEKPRKGAAVVASSLKGRVYLAIVCVPGALIDPGGYYLSMALGRDTDQDLLFIEECFPTVGGTRTYRRASEAERSDWNIESALLAPSHATEGVVAPTHTTPPAWPKGWQGESLPSGLRAEAEQDVYVWERHGLDMQMVYVPPGYFSMGTDDDDWCERPRHDHLIPEGFYVGRFEVTVAQFAVFVNETHYLTDAERDGWAYSLSSLVAGSDSLKVAGLSWRAPGFAQSPGHPVTCVSWHDARAFCEWAGLTLPSEAQWERAARGTDARRYPWGAAVPLDGSQVVNCADISLRDAHPDWPTAAWYRDGCVFTAQVGRFRDGVSPSGALDMAGNVTEWTAEWYDERAYERYALGDFAPPANGTTRVARGGCWAAPSPLVRCTERSSFEPSYRADHIGFRVVLAGANGE